jgi:hypothetical protein
VCGYRLHVGECRRHHRLKTLTRWRLRQPRPGVLLWTSLAGLTWTSMPEPQVARGGLDHSAAAVAWFQAGLTAHKCLLLHGVVRRGGRAHATKGRVP